MIAGHIEICDGAVISGATQVFRSILVPGVYTGAYPSMPHAKWRHVQSSIRRLPELESRVRELEKDAGEARPAEGHQPDKGER